MLYGKMLKRVLSVALAAVMLLGLAAPALASEKEGSGVTVIRVPNGAVDTGAALHRPHKTVETRPLDTQPVRVAIVLESKSTMDAGYSLERVAENDAAMAYRAALKRVQASMEQIISAKALGGQKLDVVWNLTLAANIISANVPYGKLDAIRAVPGVKDVVIETRYEMTGAEASAEPNMSTAVEMIGTTPAYAAGYTGAGARIAVIDTGTDTDHRSFDANAFKQAIKEDADTDSFAEAEAKLGLLTSAKIGEYFPNLNISSINKDLSAGELYVSAKLPFAYNYVDRNLDVTHDNDTQTEHGSHVAGIATANRLVKGKGGRYVSALGEVLMQGVAPDAQLITMKVFGSNGGAYDSDYMVAIEDAIVLECDSINLSLGSSSAGAAMSRAYQPIMNKLAQEQAIVVISAGNAGSWADNTALGQGFGMPYLYSDDVNLDTVGSPGSFTNSLSVASVDNVGYTGNFLKFGDEEEPLRVTYAESGEESGYTNKSILTLDTSKDGSGTEYEYVITNGKGDATEVAALKAAGVDLAGKIFICQRGGISFYVKAQNAADAGAAASVIWNNESGVIHMNLTGYTATAPAVSITEEDGLNIIALSEQGNTDPLTASYLDVETGAMVPYAFNYYTGKVVIPSEIAVTVSDSEYYTMSDFSSWGVPSSLELKPEITAPGGNIYSVNGQTPGGQAYETMSGTSMAAPQVTGMAALVAQYIKANNLAPANGSLTRRQLGQSLLMSTAEPLFEEDSGYFYSVLKQGAGLANVGAAVTANSYVTVDGQPDGKVKVELGEDAKREGVYNFAFTLHNLTNAAATYELDAGVFTQDLFPVPLDEEMTEFWWFMGTWTAPLKATTTFTVNGSAAETVTLPAGGNVTVSATITLADEGDETGYGIDDLETYYTAGAYIEAYVFATEVVAATQAEEEEGVIPVPTQHSIPVLGYYGSWSDPSMFDKGSYLSDLYGLDPEQRFPYLIINGDFNFESNYISATTPNSKGEYIFGGNPFEDLFYELKVWGDETYVPERNALNNINGSKLVDYSYSVIRNAGGAIFRIVDAEDGTVYAQQTLGALDAAYYNEQTGAWSSTTKNLTIDWAGTKTVGEGDTATTAKLDNGTQVKVELILAPEYYGTIVTDESEPKADKSTSSEYVYDWDALLDGNLENGELGEGAKLSTLVTIDNTVPVIKEDEVVVDTEEKTLTVVAQDNQYIAAIVVYNEDGSRAVTAEAPDQDTPDTEYETTLDMSDAYGTRFLVAVYDYAMNQSTYLVKVDEPFNGVKLEDELMFVDGAGTWNAYADEEATAVVTPAVTPVAATYAGGYLFTADAEGKLYVSDTDNVDLLTCIGSTGLVFDDLAYNAADETIYGVSGDVLYEVDKLSGVVTEVGEIGLMSIPMLGMDGTHTLACDEDGNFYSIGEVDGCLYTYTVDTLDDPEFVAVVPMDFDNGQSLEWSAKDNCLYWLQSAEEIDDMLDLNGDGDVDELDVLVMLDHCAGKNTPVSGYIDYIADLDGDYVVTTIDARLLLELLGDRPSNHMVTIDVATGEFTVVSELAGPGKALVVLSALEEIPDWAKPAETVEGVVLDYTELKLLVNESAQLTAFVTPWTAENKAVTWESSDTDVATVDANGLVTTLTKGTATITAKSVADETKLATCEITASNLPYTIKGALMDENGDSLLFTWDIENDDTYEATIMESLGKNGITSMTKGTAKDSVYVMDATDASNIHEIDPATAAETELYDGVGVPFWDLAACLYIGTDDDPVVEADLRDKATMVTGVYATQVLHPTDITNLENGEVSDLDTFLPDLGSNFFLAVAAGGYEQTEDWDFNEIDTEVTYMLDDNGYIWIANYVNSVDAPDTDETYYSVINVQAVDMDGLSSIIAHGHPYCSMVMSDDEEALFLSAFDTTRNTNVLYYIFPRADGMGFQSKKVAEFGNSIWPVALYQVTPNETAEPDPGEDDLPTMADVARYSLAHAEHRWKVDGSEVKRLSDLAGVETAPAAQETAPVVADAAQETAEEVSVPAAEPVGSLMSVSGAAKKDEDGAVSANVTVKDSTNGLVEVEYDADVLTLVDCTAMETEGVYVSVNTDEEGKVSVAYASLDEVTGTLAHLDFTYEMEGAPASTALTLTKAQENDSLTANTTRMTVQLRAVANITEPAATAPSTETKENEDGTVTTTVTEPDGTVTVTTTDADGEVLAEVVIPATIAEPETRFEDVPEGHWADKDIHQLAAMDVVNGVGDNKYDMVSPMTRGNLAVILHRLSNKPNGGELSFEDVPESKYYAEGIAWAAKVGVVEGFSDEEFQPETVITREQLALMLMRYAKLLSIKTDADAEVLEAYADGSATHAWAVSGMAWCVKSGIIEGRSEDTLAPTSEVTRAEVAVMIGRFLGLVK